MKRKVGRPKGSKNKKTKNTNWRSNWDRNKSDWKAAVHKHKLTVAIDAIIDLEHLTTRNRTEVIMHLIGLRKTL